MTGLLIGALTASSGCISLLAHRHLLRALCWLACRGDQDKTSEAASGSIEGGAGAGLLLKTTSQRLGRRQFWCKSLGYCRAALEMRLNRLQDQMPPPRATIRTGNGRVCVGGGRLCVGGLAPCALLLTATSEHRQRPVLSCTSCMHQLHAVRSC